MDAIPIGGHFGLEKQRFYRDRKLIRQRQG